MREETRTALCRRLSEFDRVVEIGIGRRPGVARTLAEAGVDVTATDLRERSVPDGVSFVVDDATDPDRAVYEGADAIYALNCPPDLHPPICDLAGALGVPFLFTTLGAEPPAVPADPETIPGDTLFRSGYEPGSVSTR